MSATGETMRRIIEGLNTLDLQIGESIRYANNQAKEWEKRALTAENNVLYWQRRDTEARAELKKAQDANAQLSKDASKQYEAAVTDANRRLSDANESLQRVQESASEVGRILRKHASANCKTLLDCAVDVTDQFDAIKQWHTRVFGPAPLTVEAADLDDIKWRKVVVKFE